MRGMNSAKFWKNKYFPYSWQFTGVNECICSKFMSFWVGFLRFSGLKSQMIVWSQKFLSFWVWECWKFILFMDFERVLCLESRTEMEVQNFIPFCYWKGAKFMENVHVILKKWTILKCFIDTLEV